MTKRISWTCSLQRATPRNSPRHRRSPSVEHDRLRQHALIKAIEIIGEAASRVSAETRSLNPEIPWREIVGMRNRLVHAYFEVDVELLWETVQRDIPKLIALLEPSAPPEKT